MPIIDKYTNPQSMELQEFVDYALKHTDMHSTDSVRALGEQLAMLGNNRSFLSDFFAEYIKGNVLTNPQATLTAQSVVLSRQDDFYLRANFWLPEHEMTENESYLFAYHQAHDHNFDLLSLAYCGDGYATDNFRYDYSKVHGYLGEVVDLEPLGRYKHVYGDILLYECNKDIHFQRPPEQPSITLNVVPLVNQHGLRDQYFFQIDDMAATKGTIYRYGRNVMEQRKELFGIAKMVANDEIGQLFIDIARAHPCNRTRYEALIALKDYSQSAHDTLCHELRDDRVPIIRHYVGSVLAGA